MVFRLQIEWIRDSRGNRRQICVYYVECIQMMQLWNARMSFIRAIENGVTIKNVSVLWFSSFAQTAHNDKSFLYVYYIT